MRHNLFVSTMFAAAFIVCITILSLAPSNESRELFEVDNRSTANKKCAASFASDPAFAKVQLKKWQPIYSNDQDKCAAACFYELLEGGSTDADCIAIKVDGSENSVSVNGKLMYQPDISQFGSTSVRNCVYAERNP